MTTRTTLSSGLPINVAGPKDATRAIIVLQEAFGVNSHIRDVTDRFGAQGYLAVSPELFHRDESPEIAYDDFAAALTHMGNFTREGLERDLRDTVAYLAEQGITPASIGIVGYCMGGTVATFADTLGIVGAAVSFYGGGVTNGRFGLPALVDLRGKPDLFGRELHVTLTGLADEIAAAAGLLMGQAAEGLPAVLLRGLRWSAPANPAAELVRPAQEDLFR